MKRILTTLGLAALVAASGAMGLRGDDAPAKAEAPGNLDLEAVLGKARPGGIPGAPGEKKYRDFNEVTQGAQKIEGLFTLHRKDDHLYAEIKPFQFEQPML